MGFVMFLLFMTSNAATPSALKFFHSALHVEDSNNVIKGFRAATTRTEFFLFNINIASHVIV